MRAIWSSLPERASTEESSIWIPISLCTLLSPHTVLLHNHLPLLGQTALTDGSCKIQCLGIECSDIVGFGSDSINRLGGHTSPIFSMAFTVLPFPLVSLAKMLFQRLLALILLKTKQNKHTKHLFLRTYIVLSIPWNALYVLSDLNLLNILSGKYSYHPQVKDPLLVTLPPLWISPAETVFSRLV